MEESDFEREKIERLQRAMYSRTYADKLQPKERREMKPPREEAPEDFVRPEPHISGAIVAPTGLTAMRSFLWWMLGIAILFFVAAAAFFLYYFLFGAGSLPASPDNISIAISGPPQIQGGDSTELQIVIENHNRAALQSAELVLSYPDGTRSATDLSANPYSCSGPENTSDSSLALPQQRICLGDIAAGGTRQGTVSAIFSGIGGQQETIKADLEYRLAGSDAVFVASSNYDLSFGSSPLSISVDGNSETISGQPVQLTVNVASNASSPVKDVLLSADFPFGFKLTSASPLQTSPGFWQLGDLDPGAKTSVTIQGVLTGQSGDDRVFNFTAGTRSTTTVQAIETPLSTIAQHLVISQPFLGLEVSVNGGTASSSSTVVAPGETINVSVDYQNNLDTPITDAIIVAKLSGTQFDGTTVHSNDGFYRSSDNSMIWDKTTTQGALASLAPGDKGTVGFSFQAPTSTQLIGATSPHFTISINAAGNRVAGTGVPETLLSSAVQQIAVSSNLEYTVQGLYYSNPFGSTGPLPPKAGQETTYALLFSIQNTTNKITNAVLTATLPPYVRWLNICSPAAQCSNGKFSINSLDSTLTWNIGDIAPGTGTDTNAQPEQLLIVIGFTPSTSQIGSVPALLQNISLSGVDDSTGNLQTIPLKEDVTTDLTKVSKSSQDLTPGIDAGFTSNNGTVVQ
jgi:hypothetical protein